MLYARSSRSTLARAGMLVRLKVEQDVTVDLDAHDSRIGRIGELLRIDQRT